ncbi:MAG: type II toxin-antitoxin system VapC family toxin [Rhizobium sp.]|nr:type II toxin-antitoxin system VapC family toxin [Rhizobium sp.]
MYILDTNVVSELRKKQSRRADPNVIRWAESVVPAQIYLSVVTIFEIEIGIQRLSLRGDEVDRLQRWLSDQVLIAFAERILPIDQHIAMLFATTMVPTTRPYRDTLIAATAQHHGYTVVTRNTRDFDGLPIRLLNPWET